MRKKSRQKGKGESGNHRLALVVLVLTAVFLALVMFALTYSGKPVIVNRPPLKDEGRALAADDIRTDTTTGVRSFAGVIREINNGRLTVSVSEIRNAQRLERLVLVNLPNDLVVQTLGSVKMEVTASGAPRAVREKTPADRSALKVGVAVEVEAADIVDGKTSVVAAAIRILGV